MSTEDHRSPKPKALHQLFHGTFGTLLCPRYKGYRSLWSSLKRVPRYDQIVYVHQGQGTAGTKRYIKKMRRISYRDPDSGRKFVFLTNRFDLATQTICDLYKARWKVELFFKTLKQNLKIRKLLGNSAHAVKVQIWVALIACLLIQIIRFSNKTKISVPDTMAVIGVLLLLKEPLSRILRDLPCATRHPPPFQLELPI